MPEIFLQMKCTKGRYPQSTCGWTISPLMSHPWTWQILTSSTILANIHRWCSLTLPTTWANKCSSLWVIQLCGGGPECNSDPGHPWWEYISWQMLIEICLLMSAVYSNPKGAKIDLYSRQILENWRMEHNVMEVWIRWFSFANGCFFRFKM